MSLIGTTSERELEAQLKQVKERFKQHLDGYMAHVLAELESKVEMIIEDYTQRDYDGDILTPDDPIIELSSDIFKKIFLTGKNAFKDTLEEFYEHDGDSPYDSYHTFEDDLSHLESEMQNHLRTDESEEIESTHSDLKHAAEQYKLTDSQYYQDELLKILENEYNLALITVPAKHP